MALTLAPRAIENYASEHSTSASAALRRIEKETIKSARLPQMMVGHLEGAFLASLVRMQRARRILEVGTFTGYSALAMAEALPTGGKLTTLELDQEHGRMARQGWKRSPHGRKIKLVMGHALNILPALKGPFDFCFIDADKVNYGQYFEFCLSLLRKGGYVAIDNTLWSGEVLKPRDDTSRALHAFNRRVLLDKRVETLLLPLRDGVTLARKK